MEFDTEDTSLVSWNVEITRKIIQSPTTQTSTPPIILAQGDQSPSTQNPSPGGSIPQNSAWKSQICRKDKIQSPSTQPSSPGGSIPLNP